MSDIDHKLWGRVDGVLQPIKVIRTYLADGKAKLEVEIVSGEYRGRRAAGLHPGDDVEVRSVPDQ